MTTTPDNRINLIKSRLFETLKPEHLEIVDESHLHENHPGAKESGGGHFNLEITAEVFQNKSAIERHRIIYVALGEIMGTEIHALSINAKTPEESQCTPNNS